jgi:hypothetical protein
MFWLLMLAGLVVVAAEVFAGRRNLRTRKAGHAGTSWLVLYRWRYLVGVPFGVASAFFRYPVARGTETFHIVGFPFMAAAFDQAGADYVGPFTGVALLGNAAIWFFIPQLLLWIWALVERRAGAIRHALYL